MELKKQSLDTWLDNVDYQDLATGSYVPSTFSIGFMNFIKLVNGVQGESNKTPPVHLKMLDKLASPSQYVANLIFRGAAKTTLFMEYLTLYLAVFHELPYLGEVSGMIYVTDSIENGVKSARKNIEFRYENSEFLKEQLPVARFTDTYIEFTNKAGHQLAVKLYGATTGIRGTKIYGKRPVLCHVKGTTVFTDMGTHLVEDYYLKGPSRYLKGIDVYCAGFIHKETVTPEHRYFIGSTIKTGKKGYLENNKTKSTTELEYINPRWVEAKDISINKLLGHQQVQNDYICKKIDKTINPVSPITLNKAYILARNSLGQIQDMSSKEIKEIYPKMLNKDWWWLYGLYLADGHTYFNKIGFTIANTQRDTIGAKVVQLANNLGYSVNKEVPKKGCYQISINDSAIYRFLKNNHIANSVKNLPDWVLSIDPIYQKELLLGYIAGDGYIDSNHGQIRINSINKDIIYKLGLICERLELPYHIRNTRTKEKLTTFPNGITSLAHKQYEIRLSQNVPKVLGIQITEKKSNEVFIKDGYIWRKIKEIKLSDKEQEFIPIQTPDHTYNTYFGISHNCVLDDLMSDEASKSKVILQLIKDTIYKGVNHALDPTRRKVIFNGTPFNNEDPLVEAIQSGAWDSNVYPVCEKFPCTREEFRGAWSDRFTYDYIKSQYDVALSTGQLASFYQELMLRLTSEDSKLVAYNEIRWYKKSVLLSNKNFYNFYITTDFATSAKQSADYSVISVWAVNSNGDFFWVDGQCKRTTMDNNIDKLFQLVQKYQPQAVGVEVTGQQGAFIQWLQKEMMLRNIWFSFATSGNNNAPGIRPVADKLSRFNLVVPWFKAGKFYFPEEDKDNAILKEGIQEINLATSDGLKGKDDFLDTISMLAYMKIWRPSEAPIPKDPDNGGIYDETEPEEDTNRLESYIV